MASLSIDHRSNCAFQRLAYTYPRTWREVAFNNGTSIIQERRFMKLRAGSAALFPRGLIVVLQQQKLQPMEKPTAAKISPRTLTTLIRQSYFSRPLAKPLTLQRSHRI